MENQRCINFYGMSETMLQNNSRGLGKGTPINRTDSMKEDG